MARTWTKGTRTTPAFGAWTPRDTGHNNVRWTKAGTLGLDFLVQGFAWLEVFAIANDAWLLDYYVFGETNAALEGPVQLMADVGVLGGQVYHTGGIIPVHAYCQRVRLRGRGLLGNVDNGYARVLGRAVA